MCLSLICCGWMHLALVFAFGNTTHASLNKSTTLYIHQGKSANVSCNYNLTNDIDIFSVQLHRNQTMCSYIYVNSWTNQSCKNYCHHQIRCIWIPETREASFELLNLQINDSGTYRCTVKRSAPPPEIILGEERTRVQVIARPVLSMSCVKIPDGSSMMLCSSERFYPHSLEQLWIRDGEILNSSNSHKHFNYSTNPDGSFTQKSYLELAPQMFAATIYSCWINHSSLNEPLMVNLSSSSCDERWDLSSWAVTLGFVFSAVLTAIFIIAVMCKCYRRAHQQSVSAVDVSVTPELVYQTHLQSEMLYSTLGVHHPVQCSPVRVHSPPH
ncbi:H-2 class II histocompatibility antigen, I-A beta chain isoform X1 [Xyrauchen texanus]|uniref:H-2 class II histocompatibility antigen, I-A beta chain isoform X1 n=1 Tax=Xyrauchen texanus TaxID=154827 RepID=UPI0022424E9E|nr:H-2 class II histocompatibility antigen, I-A beta chain isoform X1 [Xyrauchen texanus]